MCNCEFICSKDRYKGHKSDSSPSMILQTQKVCYCSQIIAPGKKHECQNTSLTVSSIYENFICKLPEKNQGQVVTEILKNNAVGQSSKNINDF